MRQYVGFPEFSYFLKRIDILERIAFILDPGVERCLKIEKVALLAKRLFVLNLTVLAAVFFSAYLYVPYLLPLHPESSIQSFTYNLLQYTVPLLIVYALAHFGVFRRASATEILKGSSFATVLGVVCIFTVFLAISGVGLVILGREIPEYDRKKKKFREFGIRYTEEKASDARSEKILLHMRQTGHVARVFIPPAFFIVGLMLASSLYTFYLMWHGLNYHPEMLFNSADLIYIALVVSSAAILSAGLSSYYLRESYPYLIGRSCSVISTAFRRLAGGRALVQINDRIFNAYVQENVHKGDRLKVSQIIYDRWSMTYKVYCFNHDDGETLK